MASTAQSNSNRSAGSKELAPRDELVLVIDHFRSLSFAFNLLRRNICKVISRQDGQRVL